MPFTLSGSRQHRRYPSLQLHPHSLRITASQTCHPTWEPHYAHSHPQPCLYPQSQVERCPIPGAGHFPMEQNDAAVSAATLGFMRYGCRLILTLTLALTPILTRSLRRSSTSCVPPTPTEGAPHHGVKHRAPRGSSTEPKVGTQGSLSQRGSLRGEASEGKPLSRGSGRSSP